MNDARNKMVSHTTVYMFGDILRHSTSLIMLPIYTRYLTPEDYGVIELLSMVLDVAAIIFGARVGQAVFRFYCSASSENDKKSIIASALLLGVLLDGIGAITVSLLSGPLAVAIFSDPSYQSYIALFALTLFLMPLTEIPLVHIRAQQKAWLFFTFSIIKLVLQVSLNIYFVIYREMHVEGVIYSTVISGAIMATLLTGYSLPRAGLTATKAACKKLFNFSLPLKLATIGSFYLTFGDRFILNIFTDLSQVGIYALGYKFGFIFTILAWSPFEKIWDSEKYAIHKKDDAIPIYQRTFLYISCLMILLALCISIFTKDLLKIMSDPAFHDAYKIAPIIILAYVFQGWMKYCDLGILLKNRTIQIAYAEFFAVIVVTIAYFTLIPMYGIHGAAWATVIGFAARLYWINRKGKQYYDMELPWVKVSMTAMIALFAFSLSFLVPEDNLTLSILMRVVIVISSTAIFFLLPILSKNEKKEFWEKIVSLKPTYLS